MRIKRIDQYAACSARINSSGIKRKVIFTISKCSSYGKTRFCLIEPPSRHRIQTMIKVFTMSMYECTLRNYVRTYVPLVNETRLTEVRTAHNLCFAKTSEMAEAAVERIIRFFWNQSNHDFQPVKPGSSRAFLCVEGSENNLRSANA